jgi:hypothetical protein
LQRPALLFLCPPAVQIAWGRQHGMSGQLQSIAGPSTATRHGAVQGLHPIRNDELAMHMGFGIA